MYFSVLLKFSGGANVPHPAWFSGSTIVRLIENACE
jgi:hypothetical protein